MEKNIFVEYFITDLNPGTLKLKMVYVHPAILSLLSDTSELKIGDVTFKHAKSISLGIEDGNLKLIEGLELIKSGLVGMDNGSEVILSFNSEDDKNRFKDKFIGIMNLLVHIIKLQTKPQPGRLVSDYANQEVVFIYKGNSPYKSKFYF